MKALFSVVLCFSSLSFFSQTVKADSLINYGSKFLGVKYKYGKCDPKQGFDCSGFVYYVYNNFKLNVPRASMDYQTTGKVIQIDSCRPGDIIVFTGTKISNRKPGHVGMIISKAGGEVRFMHSSSGEKANGVIITNFSQSVYYQKRFIKIVRLDSVKQ
jgi:murein DD-endopeptidase / murein LD-carboxypeptidase